MDQLQHEGPVFLIEVEKIVPNPDQPRREFDEAALQDLANSIREVGLIQPVVVSKIEKETEFGTDVSYQLIAGERRLRASKLLGLERIPAIVRKVSLDRERLELALIENIQRSNLNPIEEARAYARFQDEFGMTQREVATRLGKSREAVANALRLLNLPTEIQESVARAEVNESQARLLLGVSDMAQQRVLFEELITRNLSVRDLQARVKSMREAAEAPQRQRVSADPETVTIQKSLEELLGTKVKVERSGDHGRITINFFSPEELYGIVNKLESSKKDEASTSSSFTIGTEHDDSFLERDEYQHDEQLPHPEG